MLSECWAASVFIWVNSHQCGFVNIRDGRIGSHLYTSFSALFSLFSVCFVIHCTSHSLPIPEQCAALMGSSSSLLNVQNDQYSSTAQAKSNNVHFFFIAIVLSSIKLDPPCRSFTLKQRMGRICAGSVACQWWSLISNKKYKLKLVIEEGASVIEVKLQSNVVMSRSSSCCTDRTRAVEMYTIKRSQADPKDWYQGGCGHVVMDWYRLK